MQTNRPINTVAICGLGQMGSAAAVCFKRSGYRVLACEQNPEQLANVGQTLAALETWLNQHVGPAPRAGGSIQLEPDLHRLDEQGDVVMDCIFEDLEQKVELFKRFPAAKQRGALILTTTSGLSITRMGRQSGCEHLLAGAHFWNPPHLMPLVEVIRGEDTPETIMDSACQLVESLGKRAVRVNIDAPGFIGNRMLHALWREAINLVEKGIATPQDVDLVVKLTFALRSPVLGPLENMDLVGLDLVEKIHSYLLADLADNHGPSQLLASHVKEGNLGLKSGQGFYDWRARDSRELIEQRDLQIVHQLDFLKRLGVL